MEEIDMMRAILTKTITSCNCMTKTNVVIYHKTSCRYRRFMEDTTVESTYDWDLTSRTNVMKLLQENECIVRFENSDGDIQNVIATAYHPKKLIGHPQQTLRHQYH